MQAKRLQKEIKSLLTNPPDGVVCYPKGESLTELEAKLQPLCDPYDRGIFRLSVVCGDRYPHEPPSVRFVTPVYHPNVDSEGRICLNLLKMPPKGCWAPSYSIASVLSAVQILLSQPNPDDPLMTDITDEYRTDINKFLRKAREHTARYACEDTFADTGGHAVVQQSQFRPVAIAESPLKRGRIDPVNEPQASSSTIASHGVKSVRDCPFVPPTPCSFDLLHL